MTALTEKKQELNAWLAKRGKDLPDIIRVLPFINNWERRPDGSHRWETYPFSFIVSGRHDKQNMAGMLSLVCQIEGQTVFHWYYSTLSGLVIRDIHSGYYDWYKETIGEEAEYGLFDKTMKNLQDIYVPWTQDEKPKSTTKTKPNTKDTKEAEKEAVAMVNFFSSQTSGTRESISDGFRHIYSLETASCLSYKLLDIHDDLRFGWAMNKETGAKTVVYNDLDVAYKEYEDIFVALAEERLNGIPTDASAKEENHFALIRSMLADLSSEEEWLDEEERFLFHDTFPRDMAALETLLSETLKFSVKERAEWIERTENAILNALSDVHENIAYRKKQALEKQVRVIEVRGRLRRSEIKRV